MYYRLLITCINNGANAIFSIITNTISCIIPPLISVPLFCFTFSTSPVLDWFTSVLHSTGFFKLTLLFPILRFLSFLYRNILYRLLITCITTVTNPIFSITANTSVCSVNPLLHVPLFVSTSTLFVPSTVFCKLTLFFFILLFLSLNIDFSYTLDILNYFLPLFRSFLRYTF